MLTKSEILPLLGNCASAETTTHKSKKFLFLWAALCVSAFSLAMLLPASAVTATCQSTNFATGGLNGTGSPCIADSIYSNTPDPTSNSAPNLQDQTLNGSVLLGSFAGAGTFPGTGTVGDFTITSVGDLTGTWTYSPDLGDLFPKWVLISAGSNWFLTQLPNTLAGQTSGNWSTCPSGLNGGLCLQNPPGNAAQTLSHIAFFDGAEPPKPGPGPGPGETPIPGALWLLGTVVAGGAGFGCWRKKRKETAVIG